MEPSPLKIFLYKTKRKCLRFFPWIPYKGLKKFDLIIYDDIYPHPISGFRLEEFTCLLEEFNNSKIVVNPTAYTYINTPMSRHKNDLSNFLKYKKHLVGKIRVRKHITNINAKLFYCVFLSNIYQNLPWLEKFKIPFVFTLYPGGGFMVNDKATDAKMGKVFTSPMFRHVFVTQQYTKDYLIENNLCAEEKIKYIFGGVVPQDSLVRNTLEKKMYLKNKKTFDICFCAAKYTPKGKDKGYDLFIETAHRLAEKFDFIRFHVIGGFTSDDIDISCLEDKIKFYGYQNFESLSGIYKKMDVFLSPNRPFVLNNKQFDGFPLGTVVEAAFNGVAVIISDCLKQNAFFIEGEEIIIIENTVESIEIAVVNLINNPDKLKNISQKGRDKFLKIYSNAMQIDPRIKLLNAIINE